MRRLSILLSAGFLLFACNTGEKVTVIDLRQREIDRRVAQFIMNKESECYDNTMAQAISLADSILKTHAVKYVEDSLVRPPLPTKPELMLKPAPRDSILPRPFILPLPKDSIRQDSVIEQDSAQ